MKSIILAAGYATRLYPLTENHPKPLLEMGDCTILDLLIKNVDDIDDIDSHFIISNHKFYSLFCQWAQQTAPSLHHPVTIIDDGSETNEQRMGAVSDLLLALDRLDINDDIMVLAADNILDFSLKGFAAFFKEKEASVIMCHHEPELKLLQRTGVIRVDENMKVIEMQEKPLLPKSHWAVPPFYIYKRSDLPLIQNCLNHGCGTDAPGNLAHYLADKTTIYAWEMPGRRIDIGTIDSYTEAQKQFASHKREQSI